MVLDLRASCDLQQLLWTLSSLTSRCCRLIRFDSDRAYFSAINPSDIQKAYKVLGKPDKNQALSVDARQELDLKVGVAFSRFQTRYFQGRYGDLDRYVGFKILRGRIFVYMFASFALFC